MVYIKSEGGGKMKEEKTSKKVVSLPVENQKADDKAAGNEKAEVVPFPKAKKETPLPDEPPLSKKISDVMRGALTRWTIF